MNIDNLCIEVTRKCQLACLHCLRGDTQEIDIENIYIDNLLKQTSKILNVTFTGGEPSLNPDAINFFLTKCKEYEIELDTFYIATNAIDLSESFLHACVDLYLYCENRDSCIVAHSNDDFHEALSYDQKERLKIFSFSHEKYPKDFHKHKYLNEGNYACNYGDGLYIKKEDVELDTENKTIESVVYLNCLGNMIDCCDLSYENQDEEENIICKSTDDIWESYVKKYYSD